MSMKFEYDPAKSAANKAKHGLDFEEAKALWKDENPCCAPGSRAFLSLAALGARSGPGLSHTGATPCASFPYGAPARTRWNTMDREHISAEEFDRRFDAGEDISGHVDWAAGRRPNKQTQRVNVDFPTWMVEALDTEARHLGVSRQALVKVWIANCLARDAHSAR